MAEGLVIPISTPGGEESAAVLDRIADKLEEVGGAAGNSATKMGTSATASSAAIGRIATATENTKTAVERLEESGNRGLHALSEKASELAGSMGGAAGKIADVGLKSLAAFGGIGLQATAAVGAVLMLYNAYVQYENEQRAVAAGAAELAAAQNQLGGTYASLTAAANSDGTAEQRVNAIRAAGLAILQEQLSLIGSGFSRQEAESLNQSYNELAEASGGRLTAALIRHAAEAGNAAEQQRVLGVAIEQSSNPVVEHANALRRVGLAREVSIRAQMEELRAQAQSNDGTQTAIGRLQSLTQIETQLATAREHLTEVTRENAIVNARAEDAIRDSENARLRALHAADAAADEANRKSELDKQRRHRTGGGSAPTAQELRAQAEALRLAREANDNAGRTITFEQQMESLRLRLAFATREVALAQATHHDHTRRLTAALQAQTEVMNAQRAAVDAQLDSYRPLRETILALTSAEEQRLQVALDVEKSDAAKIRNGQILLRQEELAATVRQRAREDAVAAAAAFASGGETSAERAGISTGESARAALATAEADATRDLARATQDLAQARREESDLTISAEERTTHVTEALARQTAALQRQRAAQAASNAEVQRIRTDRVDTLANATKGLADGLMATGIAAGIAGDELAGALQKQLAESLKALAIEAAQKALFATATGLFQLATGNPAAASSFASAATFAAVAVAAGGISSAITDREPPKAAAAIAGGSERAGNVTPRGAGSSEGGTVINVNFGGSTIVGGGGARGAAREIANVLNDGARLGGVRLSPGLMGAR